VGARQLLCGAAHDVVGAADAARWLEALLVLDFKSVDGAAFAITQIARATGDRARDLPVDLRERVAARLERAGALPGWPAMVRDVVALSVDDEAQAWGEALPIGLRL
jgi:hypothetical protein